ncbi:MAG TPA: hypothetical protein VFG60_09245 [Burkholderiaceae bacterium]|nr:hypothetical protein [Burkholderiaceae bacterium]
MTTSITVHADARYIEVVHRDLLTRTELEDARVQTARLLAENGLVRLLIDGRQADMSAVSHLDVFEFTSGHAAELPSIGLLRMALLVAEAQAEVARFVETVAQNRGVNLRLFFDVNEAQAWITGQDA